MTSTTTLSDICILRHAEKPHRGDSGYDEKGDSTTAGLTIRGWQHAGALVALFAPNESLLTPKLPVPTALATPSYPDPVHRPLLTLLPLGQKLQLTVDEIQPVDADPVVVVRGLLGMKGNAAVLCWEHQHIPPIASALGATLAVDNADAIPTIWPDDRFDLLWLFYLSGTTSHWEFNICTQSLLPNDESTP